MIYLVYEMEIQHKNVITIKFIDIMSSLCLAVWVSPSLCLSHLCPAYRLSVCLSLSLSLSLSLDIFVYLIYLSIYLSMSLSMRPSNLYFIYLCIMYAGMCLYIYIYIYIRGHTPLTQIVLLSSVL